MRGFHVDVEAHFNRYLHGVVLPKEMLTRMRVQKGDFLFAVETSEGYHISPVDQETAEQVGIAREGMKRFRETLTRLAK